MAGLDRHDPTTPTGTTSSSRIRGARPRALPRCTSTASTGPLTLSGANLVANSSNLSVGAGYGDVLHFAGAIDEVALYGRALSRGGGHRPLPGRPQRHRPQPAEDARRRDPPRGPGDRCRRGRTTRMRARPIRTSGGSSLTGSATPSGSPLARERTNCGWATSAGQSGRRSTGSRQGVMRSSRTSAGRATRAPDASRATTARTSRCARASTRRARVP